MVKKHLKRINSPKHWLIPRKGFKWVTRPMPGPHNLHASLPLGIVIKELIRLARTSKECRSILKRSLVCVNNIKRKNEKFPVGFLDKISIPSLNEHYCLLLNKKGFIALRLNADLDKGLCKITNKRNVSKAKIQLSFHDGSTLLTESKEFKVGDVIQLTAKKEVALHLPFKEGMLAYITKGRYRGALGIVKAIKQASMSRKGTAILSPINCPDKTEIETAKEYIFIIGRDSPAIDIAFQ